MTAIYHSDSKREGPNRLLWAIIFLSVIVHFFAFLHISGLYRSKLSSIIELTLTDLSKPEVRDIPRPRQRNKNIQRPDEVKKIKITRRAPDIKPVKIEPFSNNLQDSIVEKIGIPDVPDASSYSLSDYLSGTGNYVEYETAEAYLEMVKLKIESAKKYPEGARIKRIEGNVVVSFILTMQGGVRDIKVQEKSRSLLLDNAAIEAVKNAAPFPRPSKRFFESDVQLVVKVVFELT